MTQRIVRRNTMEQNPPFCRGLFGNQRVGESRLTNACLVIVGVECEEDDRKVGFLRLDVCAGFESPDGSGPESGKC